LKVEDLSQFDVSETIIFRLKELGFETLTETQERAIQEGLYEGRSLLINAPTNTGKTFIGELAVLNISKKREKNRSFFLVPLKALAEQVFSDLVERYENWGLKVAISTSEHYENDGNLMGFDVIVSTYEKLNALMVKKPEVGEDIGLVVIDEIQHIGDRTRGIALEMLLTKLRIYTQDIQIIGLSATVSNADQLADWLKSHLVQVEKRDVELREGVLYTGSDTIKFQGFALNQGDFLFREFNTGKVDVECGLNLQYIARIIEKSKEEQMLLFLNSQRSAEKLADDIAKSLPELIEMRKLTEEIDSLSEYSPITERLKEVLKKGIAFHHAGLLTDERRIVEDGFRNGSIRIICSTPTLAAGVNTPAKNVIVLFKEYVNGSNLPVANYKSISGRSGRLRKGELFGRSLLLADSEKGLEFLWSNYVNAKPERVVSQIPQRIGFDCSLLGLISSGICSTREELKMCMEMTLFSYIASIENPIGYKISVSELLNQAVDRLLKMGLATENEELVITELGLRCAEDFLSPQSVLLLYDVIRQNSSKLMAMTDYEALVPGLIHLCCCTQNAEQLYPPRSNAEIQELDAIWTVARSSYFYSPSDREIFLTTLRTARMILRWIEGVSYYDLYSYAPAGTIKRIAENLQWILRGLARLVERPLFDFREDFGVFLQELADRVYFGVPKDALLVARLRIKGIHRLRSMNLAKAGFRNIDAILEANVEELEKIPNIGGILARRIKEKTEEYIEDEVDRKRAVQTRLTYAVKKPRDLIDGLYDLHGDDLSKHIARIFKEELKIDAEFIGTDGQHEPDILVRTQEGNIVIEVKRKEKGKVPANEAEEIFGKGAKYKPIANVTIGYPDFVDVVKENAINAKLTLIDIPKIGELLTGFWSSKLTSEDVISLLRLGRCVYDLQSTLSKVTITK
jgi:helicase